MPKSSTDKRHFVIIGVLIVIGTVIMGLLLNAVLPMPTAAAVQAGTVDWLFSLHMWLIAFLFALVGVFMLYSFVVFRRRKGDDSEGEHFEGNTALEVIWTVVPLVVVVIFGFIGVRTLTDVTKGSPDEVVIKAVGKQWFWIFDYGNGVTGAELRLPVDKPVRMEMTSDDVIHSFWVPEFRVKQDLVPGMTTHLNFTPSLTGEYTLRCTELCGMSHTTMEAPVKVMSQADFTAWLDEKLAEQGQQTVSR